MNSSFSLGSDSAKGSIWFELTDWTFLQLHLRLISWFVLCLRQIKKIPISDVPFLVVGRYQLNGTRTI